MRDLFARMSRFYFRIQFPLTAIGIGVLILLILLSRSGRGIFSEALGILLIAVAVVGGILSLFYEFWKKK
jgi:hypothetical protein